MYVKDMCLSSHVPPVYLALRKIDLGKKFKDTRTKIDKNIAKIRLHFIYERQILVQFYMWFCTRSRAFVEVNKGFQGRENTFWGPGDIFIPYTCIELVNQSFWAIYASCTITHLILITLKIISHFPNQSIIFFIFSKWWHVILFLSKV